MNNTIRKDFTTELQVNTGKREVLAIVSTNAIDRDGEIVKPDGLKRRNYAGNPVVLVNHDYASLPIGKCLWIKPDGDKVIAKYVVSDKTQLARDVWGLLQDGVLGAHSIGFRSLRATAPTTAEKKVNPDWENAKLVHREWELLEFSIVGVPANPEALTLAVSKGLSPEVRQILEGDAGDRPLLVEVKGVDRVSDLSPDAIRRAAVRVQSINVDRLVAGVVKTAQ